MKTKSDAKSLDRIDVPLEIKQVSEDDDFFIFEGMASTFGNIDLTDDIVAPGAFQESISKELPVILWQHDSREPIGVPIEVKETADGLFIRVKLPKEDTFVSGRVAPQLRVGSIKSMSIGFRTIKSEMDNDSGIRTLVKVDLKEVSLVTFPANPEARVTGFKSVEDVKEIKTRRDFEKALRESGAFSKEAACLLAKNFMDQGEPDDEEKAAEEALLVIKQSLEDLEASKSIRSMINKLEK